ncbi:hypothetical protein [Paracoccus sp. (in: a-proteobacteria)]|uniref:hypothetical protein n=1 Tax=Paracoccus sp. TaxID=267 RepID=UPI003A84C02A
MKRLTNRRSLLLAAGLLAAGTASARSADLSGSVRLADGTVLPKGDIRIYLEDAAHNRAASAKVKSDGASKAVAFTLPLTADNAAAPMQIVARLERSDGWLLARGSAKLEPESPIDITLYTVMY